jgi:A/G-specific adenine glycosylase
MQPMTAHPLHEPVHAWYLRAGRDLPWRTQGCHPWGILVSEVMLQQTPVIRVLPAWQAWLGRWPTPAALAADPPSEAIRMWNRLGYPRRALRLHAAAVEIVDRHGGEVPADHALLLTLPGVGGYTAAAVASFAFGHRHAVLDTNVRRVLARTVGGQANPAPTLTVAETDRARQLVPDEPAAASGWAVAVMELGALICTARAPRCVDCPVADLCRWRAAGYPPYDGPARRGQTYAGTDRYVRGLILAMLRAAPDAVAYQDLVATMPVGVLRDREQRDREQRDREQRDREQRDREQRDREQRDREQRDRCLDALVADGLAEPLPGNRFCLPRSRR